MSAGEKESKDESFDRILEIVGNDGHFQKRYNILFNYCLLVAVMMPTVNIYMALAVPKHWCHVPGRENTNYSLEEWKGLTIPKDNNSQGEYTFSSCKMYNISNLKESNIIDCQFGWEYDQTWFLRTVVTQENWVCDRELHVTHTFVFTKIGDLLGTFIFGQLADLIGRRPTFFITVAFLFTGRTLSVFTSGYVWIFAFAAMLANLATPCVFQTPLTIAMEISKVENRAFLATTQAMGSTTALCLFPLVFWILRDWIPFMLVTSIPCSLYLFTQKCIVESPRWLASKQKTKKCIKELTKIAKANGNILTDEVAIILETNRNTEKTTYGFMSLFSNWALTKKTVLLMNIFNAVNFIYFTLVMNLNNLEGNPFMNYFLQGLAELPAAILGKYSCDKIGRRLSHQGGFIASAICSTLLFFMINNNELQLLSSIMAVILKFCITFTFYGVNLHTIETFPTCIRQTGIGFCVITASGFATLCPYITYLGTSVNLKYPYIILASVAIFGAICGLFLPDTLNKRLPDVLEDAKEPFKSKKSYNNSDVDITNTVTK